MLNRTAKDYQNFNSIFQRKPLMRLSQKHRYTFPSVCFSPMLSPRKKNPPLIICILFLRLSVRFCFSTFMKFSFKSFLHVSFWVFNANAPSSFIHNKLEGERFHLDRGEFLAFLFLLSHYQGQNLLQRGII